MRRLLRGERTPAFDGGKGKMMLKIYLITVGAMSLITFFFFLADKLASKGSGARVPEIVLLTLATLGGGVGALLGKVLLRHKSNARRKWHFAIILNVSVILQVAVAACFAYASISA